MNTTPNNMSYHDLSSLQQIRSNSTKDQAGALRQAAEQFESIFFSMLLGSMRKANEAFEADGMMNSETTKFYRDMQDSQMATELAQKGALGLADLLVQQLSPAIGVNAAPEVHKHELVRDNSAKELTLPKIILPKVSIKPKASIETTDHVMPYLAANHAVDVAQSKTDWQATSPAEFVKNLLPAARQTAKALGLDPLALVAQAALETGWGKRMIKDSQGGNSFNLFGIKANNGWQGKTAVVDTLEYRGGIAKKEQAKFRSYESPEHSMQDYVNFIKQNPRYQDAVNASGNAKAYFEQLQAAGYATDPAYAQKIMAVYQSPALQQADLQNSQIQEIDDTAE